MWLLNKNCHICKYHDGLLRCEIMGNMNESKPCQHFEDKERYNKE